MKIPEGWKLVPIEPTQEMIEGMWRGDSYMEGWKDALEAAPTPPAQEDDVNSCTSSPVVAHETGNVNDKQDSEVGILYVSLFRGHLENTHFDYYGDLPEGSYSLYTRPDNSGLRKAAEKALEILEEINSVSRCALTTEIIENIRAALENK